VDKYKDVLGKIRSVLSDNPRGLTISEISNTLGINRNSVAKYTDVLLTLEHIEMKRIGPAKMYYLSDRIPISAMLNFSKDSIIVFNEMCNVVQINDSALRLMKVKREDVIGQDFAITNPMHNNTHSMIKRNIEESLDGTEASFEYSLKIDEEEKYFHMKFIPTSLDIGSSGSTLIMEDITVKKQAEKRIRESDDQFRLLFNALDVGVAIIGPEGTPYKINPKLEQIFYMKYDSDKSQLIKSRNFERIQFDGSSMPPEEMAGPRARDSRKRVNNVFMGLKWDDGGNTWLNVSAEPVISENGEVDKIIVFYEDITEKVSGMQSLKRAY